MSWHLGLVVCLLGLNAAVAADECSTATSQIISSSDGRIRVEVFLDKAGEQAPLPLYRVSFRGRPVALPSRLGIELADGSTLGAGSTIEAVKTRSFRETYTQFPGKCSRVLDHGSEAVIALRERAAPSRRWEVVVRAYDDGIAYRYRFPAQEGWSRLEIAGERTGFRLPEDAVAYLAPMESFTTPHEERYQKKPVAKIPKEWLVGLPMLVELPGTGWVALMEAGLVDYRRSP